MFKGLFFRLCKRICLQFLWFYMVQHLHFRGLKFPLRWWLMSGFGTYSEFQTKPYGQQNHWGLELTTIWIWRVLHHMGSEYKTIWIWNVVRSYGHGHASNIWALEHSLMMDPPESPGLTFRLFPVVWARSSKWGHPETIGFPQFYGHVLDSPKLPAHPCWHRRRRQSQLRVRFKVLNVCNMQNRIL